MGNEKLIAQIAEINKLLGSAIPTLGLAFGAINLVRDMFRRHEAGEAQATFDENVTLIREGGAQMQATSEAWLEANGYNPDGTRKA